MNLLVIILSISFPLVILAWLLPEKWQLTPLTITTAIFLGFVSPISFILLITSTLTSFYILKYFKSLSSATLVIVIQMSTIFLFFKLKYNISFNLSESSVLPLGLSYYSFRIIHYALETYKKLIPKHTIIDYLNYLFFLPTILIGPINRFQPFLKDKKKRRWDNLMFSQGLERIIYGLVKIVFLGNYLLSSRLNNYILEISSDKIWLATYLKMIKFFANAYIQFAGFSDIAIGLSLLFGFKITENFNYPFLATNIADFWRKWHISLSEWCRDYVYYPFLAITRNGKISIILSMIILGAWHEISLRYIFWGILHAIAINIWYKYDGCKFQKKLHKYPLLQRGLGIMITLHFVMLSFVFISENNLSESFKMIQVLLMIKK